jgi:glycosyltransferase involved in cell wall biosynthesis
MGLYQTGIFPMNLPHPKISIVTPSFNQGAFIEEALISVKDQNYPAVEHIVVDGASTDQTVEILRRYTGTPGWEHLRWISEPDRGQSDALNKGFRIATGDIIGWMNSDDRYRQGCFATMTKGFTEHPAADVLYGDYTWMDENGHITDIRREIEFSRFILSYHHVLYIGTVSTFFRRRLFDEGNFLNINLKYAMDYEFFLRLAEKGYRFKHLPSVLADFRWHPQSKSTAHSDDALAEQDMLAVMYSPLLRGMKGTLKQKLILAGLRCVAAGLRYTEKLLCGYYFERFWPRDPYVSAALEKQRNISRMNTSKVLQLFSLLPSRPVEFFDRLVTVVERKSESVVGVRNGHGHALAFTDALSAGLGISSTDIAKLLAERELQELETKVSEQIAKTRGTGPFDSGHNGNFYLARSIYVLCRLLSPNIVLETGVAYGVTSAFTLQALAVNRKGTLVSVDLPPLGKDADRHVGRLIPQELKARWLLHRGPAKRILPKLFPSVGEVDVFVHDSLHTYRHMSFEFETAWPYVRPGGALVADNVDLNYAFCKFGAEVDPAFSAVVKEENTTDLFGIIIKRT